MLLVLWKLSNLPRRRPNPNPPQADDRPALVAPLNKQAAQTGQDIPVADLLVDKVGLHNRDGKIYLIGAVQNRSSRDYGRVHIIFDTYDNDHKPTVVQGDVSGVAAGKETSFELGPVLPLVRTFVVRSIQPVE